MIINEAMARYWKHGDALGGKKSLLLAIIQKDKDWYRVVGIVGDIKDTPKNAGAEPAFWWSMEQEPWPLAANSSIAIRSDEDPKLIADRLRTVVGQVDSTLAVAEVRTMRQLRTNLMRRSDSQWL